MTQKYLDFITLQVTEITEVTEVKEVTKIPALKDDEATQTMWTDCNTGHEIDDEVSEVAFYIRVIVASVMISLTLVGLCGNALVIIAVIVAKKLRTITNILVINLALADLLTCSSIPFQVAGILSQSGQYPLPEVICATVGGVTGTCLCCSAVTLVAIATIRWYVITRSVRGHQGIYTPRKIVALAVFIWIGSLSLIIIPPSFGFGTLGYSEGFGICYSSETNPLDYQYVMLQGTVIVLTLLLTITFYIKILHHVVQHNRRFTSNIADKSKKFRENDVSSISGSSGRQMFRSAKQKEIRITKNLFMVVCVFVVCLVSSSITLMVPYWNATLNVYPPLVLMIVNSVANPIIYGLKHPTFREVFKRILSCRRKAV